MNATFLRYLVLPEEEKLLSTATDDEQLLDALLKQQYLTVTDWKGEDTPRQIGNFLQARLHALKPGFHLDIDSVYTSMEAEASGFEAGDGIPFLLTSFQTLLEEEGFIIVLLDRGNDSYYIGLIPGNNKKNLKKQSTPLGKWRAFGELSGEVLYTVYCSCGSMNVWQVKRGELIDEEGTCERCGQEIFDKKGKTSFPVITEYI
ncbi:hypothetical protein HHL17_15870 [Chitinophaga sp. G-6-1-13]|uniref:DUF6630 domain-containing protein n=1 Tax=Chitinophaga fulva TaxID=2728842 RepID=A0A848GK56_9BACT|nr:hypothetical protein [Chitinophaga fulva]NML38686.1 hypothetical protein [Chitinophaga fulva]